MRHRRPPPTIQHMAIDVEPRHRWRRTPPPSASSSTRCPSARRRAADQPVVESLVGDQRRGQLGLEVARRDAVDGDAVRCQLHRHRAWSASSARPCWPRTAPCSVWRKSLITEQVLTMRPALARDHAPRHRAADVERSCRGWLCSTARQSASLDFGERRAPRGAGVVDQDVESARPRPRSTATAASTAAESVTSNGLRVHLQAFGAQAARRVAAGALHCAR